MTLKAFKHELMEGIPNELPPAYEFNPNLNHSPQRKDSLNKEEKKLALKNALRYFPKKHHAVLAPEFAQELEAVALKDQYFIDRGLYPNVDFYSGIIYRALGIPTDMFTVMFALGRLPGWIAQWKEMRENGDPIGRPRQVYTGHNERPYVEMNKR